MLQKPSTLNSIAIGVIAFLLVVALLPPMLSMAPYMMALAGALHQGGLVHESLSMGLLLALLAAGINLLLGLMMGWVLVRTTFRLKALIHWLVKLPFAFPPATLGLMLVMIYQPSGWIGGNFGDIIAPVGLWLALILVGLPFVTRAVMGGFTLIEPEAEDAAAMLGATRRQVFTRIMLPYLLPSLINGFLNAFARAAVELAAMLLAIAYIPALAKLVPLSTISNLTAAHTIEATSIAITLLVVAFVTRIAVHLQRAAS